MVNFKKNILSRKSNYVLLFLIMFSMISILGYTKNFENEEVFIYSNGFGNGGYLGVSIVRIPKKEKEKLGVKFGVKVNNVEKKSPAYKAGIKTGDVIQYFNKEKIRTPYSLTKIVRKQKPGTRVKLHIVRNKKNKTISLKLGDYNKTFQPKYINKKRAFLGVQLENMTADFGDYFGVKNGEGALIRVVEADTPAEESGFRAGDVIIKIEDKTIKNANDVSKVLAKFKKGDTVNIVFLRHKKKMSVRVDLDERERFGGFNFKFNFDKLRHLKELKALELESGALTSNIERLIPYKNELNSSLMDLTRRMKRYEIIMKKKKEKIERMRREKQKIVNVKAEEEL